MSKHRSIISIFAGMYQKVITKRTDELNFWVLLSFIITFTFSRLIVYNFPGLGLRVHDVHIHHYAYGIIILALVGFLALNDFHQTRPRVLGLLYGLGLGMSMDEFGMWIRLEDDYWVRRSYDAVFITAAILIYYVYFQGFWHKLFNKLIQFLLNKDEDEEEKK